MERGERVRASDGGKKILSKSERFSQLGRESERNVEGYS